MKSKQIQEKKSKKSEESEQEMRLESELLRRSPCCVGRGETEQKNKDSGRNPNKSRKKV